MLIFQGTVQGVKREQKTNKQTGEIYYRFYVGLSNPKVNGYNGELVIQDFQITKNQLEKGVDEHYKKLVGKQVQVEVFANHRAFKDRVYSDWMLGGDGLPMNQEAKLKAAS